MPLARFCPRCGAPVQALGADSGRCLSCARELYASSSPAAGVFLERNGKLLLVRRAAEPARGRWDIPGGYLREGETPEDGARREIREELGIELGELRFLVADVNPHADGAVLDLLFETGDLRGEPRPGDDAAGIGWFDPEALPAGELAFPATARLLARWREARAAGPLRLLDGETIAGRAEEQVAAIGEPWTRMPAGWSVESGEWSIHEGWLCGRAPADGPAALWLDRDVAGDHLVTFTAWAVPPCANDLNCYWEGSGRILEPGGDVGCTIGGVGGWWRGLCGIARYPEVGLRATTEGPVAPGRAYRIAAGRRGTTDFLFVDGRLVLDLDDPSHPRRARSRVALATWGSHVHYSRAAVYALGRPGRTT